MPIKPFRPCNQMGCPELIRDGRYCERHKKEKQKQIDDRRGSSRERGYDGRWQKYSKWFLRQPQNVFCKIRLPGCNNLAQCVDHVDPPDGPNDPRFWDTSNHQAACIRCNSVKGHRKL